MTAKIKLSVEDKKKCDRFVKANGGVPAEADERPLS